MRLINVNVAQSLARTVHLIRVLLAPALRPLARLLAFSGLSISGLTVCLGLFGHPPSDRNRLRYRAATLQVQAIREALEMYRRDCGEYPPVSGGLDALTEDPGVEGWRGPYLKSVPLDPWQQSYLYSRSSNATAPEVLSYGADRKPGGSVFSADISSLRPNQPIPTDPAHTRRVLAYFGVWIGAWIAMTACGTFLIRTLRPTSR
jgi:type II secretion system protein G